MNELYSQEIDGHEVVGVMFNSRNGELYEFQDPETHDDYERVVCPRTGEEISFEGEGNRLMGMMRSGHKRITLPIEPYKELREKYVGMDEVDYEWMLEAWVEMAENDPREEIDGEELREEFEEGREAEA